MRSRQLGFLLLCVCLASGVSGCINVGGGGAPADAPTYYVLEALGTPDTKAEPLDLYVAVGSVTLPHYLQRTHLVTHKGDGTLDVSTSALWAEPLEEGIMRVMVLDIATLLGSDHVRGLPWKADPSFQYQVEVDVQRFGRNQKGEVLLRVGWRIHSVGREGGIVIDQLTDIVVQAEGESYGAMVSSMNQALLKLSWEITQTLRELSRGG